MQHLIEIGEIKQRASAIGVSLKVLSRAAGVHYSTAYRAAKGLSDIQVGNLRKLTDELLRREAAVRNHILRVGDAA